MFSNPFDGLKDIPNINQTKGGNVFQIEIRIIGDVHPLEAEANTHVKVFFLSHNPAPVYVKACAEERTVSTHTG